MNKATIKRTTMIIILLGVLILHPSYSGRDESDKGPCFNADIALFRAACEGDLSKVKQLLKDGADATKSIFGKTVLMAAVEGGNVKIVKLLLEQGSDLRARNYDDVTVLMVAAKYGINVEVVKLLLEKGADLRVETNASGNTALTWAAMSGNAEVFKLLLERGWMRKRKIPLAGQY